jgi:hypothetical protein
MKERPILFSGPMVRALLDGSKTQTRRIVKNQPPADVASIRVSHYHPTVIDRRGGEQPGAEIFGAYSDDGEWGSKCPFGERGDHLWVRETAKCGYRSEQPPANTGRIGVDFKAGGGTDRKYTLDRRDDYPWFPSKSHNADGSIRWTPGIHMPRWASRISLEVTGVRVERLQGISESDAIAEGLVKTPAGFWSTYGRSGVDGTYSPVSSYHYLWESINGDGSWDANPWVWVVEFKRVNTSGEQ